MADGVLKLIRRKLSEPEKKQVQPRLQKAYFVNGQVFYVYALKQKGNVKQKFGYIGRYMRRPAIEISRIEESLKDAVRRFSLSRFQNFQMTGILFYLVIYIPSPFMFYMP